LLDGSIETIRCLLCRGVVCYSPDDDSRYKDHLNVEHRVYYYLSWIIDKTVEENCKEEIDAQTLSLPNLTITPIHKIKNPPTNGCLPSTSSAMSSATAPPFMKKENGWGTGSAISEEDESPVLSVFPIISSADQTNERRALSHNSRAATLGGEGLSISQSAPSRSDSISVDDSNSESIEISAREEIQEMADDSMGYMEAKIITIRVEGQRQGGRKMYKCSLCPNIKPWPTVHKAERHRITHIPLAFRKMFQCPQCKERFIKEKNVKRHLDSGLCQGPKDHPCTVCGEVFQSKFDLQLHEESHEQLLKRHRCRLCGAKFNKMKYLNKHILSHSNRKPYKCDICGKSFKSEYYVKTHRNAHFSDGSMGAAMLPPNAAALMAAGDDMFDDDEELDIEEHLAPEIDLIEEEGEEGMYGGIDDEGGRVDDDSGLVGDEYDDDEGGATGMLQDDEVEDVEVGIPGQAVLT